MLFKLNIIKRIIIKILIILSLAFGITLLLIGFLSIFYIQSIFQKIIFPLAGIFSQTGYIRQQEWLWREWINFGRYFLNIIGFIFILFTVILDKLQRESLFIYQKFNNQKESLRNYEYIKKRDWLYIICLVLIIIIGVILRSINLNQSLWSDEISTVYFAKSFRLWQYPELGSHWLYTFLTYLVINFFGENEIMIRLPAFILGIITIPLIYFFVKYFFSKKEAILSAFLFSITYFHINYSNSARGYSGLVFFSLLSSFLFIKIITNKKNKYIDFILFTVSTICGFLVHFYYIWVILAQYFTVLFAFIVEKYFLKKTPVLRINQYINLIINLILGVLIAFFIYGPNFISAVISKYITWKGIGELVSFSLIANLFMGKSDNLWGVFFSLFMLFSLIDFWKNKRRIILLYFLFLILIPLIIVRIICKNAPSYYFIYTLPFLLILFSHSIFLFKKIFVGILQHFIFIFLVSIYLILQVSSLEFYYSYYKRGYQDFRSVGELIDKYAKNEDIIYAIGIGKQASQYYIKKYKVNFRIEEDKFIEQINSNNRIWLIVTFPEHINNKYQPDFNIYEIAKKKLKLWGYFPGMGSDLIVLYK